MIIYSLFGFLGLSTLILALYAHWNMRQTWRAYSQVPTEKRITGKKFAELVLRPPAKIEETKGFLTDHYDPGSKVLRLSRPVATGNSIAAVSVAAHETGHFLQDRSNYLPLRMRNSLVPAVNTSAFLILPLIFFGSIFDPSLLLVNIGILLFGLIVIFYLITLPVEFDASRRAVGILVEKKCLSREELEKAKKVLLAAALTYMVGTIIATVELFRLLMLKKR